MIGIKQYDIEIILREVAEQTEKRLINEGVPVLVTYHAYVVNDRIRESRISVNRTDIKTYTPVSFENIREVVKIAKGKTTVDEVSAEHALNYVLWYT